MNKFEELLNGRAIEELSPGEIQDMIENMSANDIEKFEQTLTKPRAKKASKKQKEAEDLINQAILKGLRK